MGRAKTSLMEEGMIKILKLAWKNRKALKLESTQTFGREAKKHVAEKEVNTWKQDIIRLAFGREVRKLKAERNKKVLDLDFTPTLGKSARKHAKEEKRKVLKMDFRQILQRGFGDSLEIRISGGPGSRMIWVVPGSEKIGHRLTKGSPT